MPHFASFIRPKAQTFSNHLRKDLTKENARHRYGFPLEIARDETSCTIKNSMGMLPEACLAIMSSHGTKRLETTTVKH